MGGTVLGIRIGFGKKFGSGDCLVYPLCGFAVGVDALVIWTMWTAVLLMSMPLGWAWYQGKRVGPLRRLRRIVFPISPAVKHVVIVATIPEALKWRRNHLGFFNVGIVTAHGSDLWSLLYL